MVKILQPEHNHSHQPLSKQDEPTLEDLRDLSSDQVDGDWHINRASAEIQRKYKEAVEDARESQDDEEIMDLIAFATINEIFEAVDLNPLSNGIQDIRDTIQTVHSKGMRRGVEDLNQYGRDIPHTPNGSRSSRWLDNRLNNLINNIERSTEQSVIQAIERGRVLGLSDEQILDDVKMAMGLTPRYHNAVQNFRRLLQEEDSDAVGRLLDASEQQQARKIVENGGTDEEINELSLAYADHLVNDRADRLAETEANKIFNMGIINQLQEPEVLGTIAISELKKIWITAQDERVCNWCRPLHGTTVGIISNFESSVEYSQRSGFKTMTAQAPGLHIRCRCRIVIRPR